MSAVLSISHRELSRGQTSVGCSEHSTSQTAERSVFCRLFRTFLVADSRESGILSAVPSISRYKQPRDPTSVGCFERFISQKAESPLFCRLFRAFHVAISREIRLLSGVPSILCRELSRDSASVGFSLFKVSSTADIHFYNRLLAQQRRATSKIEAALLYCRQSCFGQIRIICISLKT